MNKRIIIVKYVTFNVTKYYVQCINEDGILLGLGSYMTPEAAKEHAKEQATKLNCSYSDSIVEG